MYLWRLPFFAAIGIVTSVVTLLGSGLLLYLRSRLRGQVARGLCSAGAVGTILVSPVLFAKLVEPALMEAALHGTFIDAPPYAVYSPLFVIAVLTGGWLLFPDRGNATATIRWRIAFTTLMIAFTVLNLANLCNPGWCARFGFPFPYLWWSDAVVEINGKSWSAGTSIAAAAADVAVVVVGSLALSVAWRRASAQTVTPPPAAARH